MTIAFRSSSATNAGSTTSLVITKPAGVAAGDLLVMEVVTDPQGQVLTPPGGWSTLLNTRFNSNLNGYGLFWLLAGGSEPANYTVTASVSGVIRGGIFAYTGVDAVTPIDVGASSNTGNSTTVTANGVTTVTNNAMVFCTHGNNGNPTSISTPGSFTNREAFVGSFLGESLNDRTAAVAGATGNATLSLGTARAWISYLFALREAVAVANVRNRAMIASL